MLIRPEADDFRIIGVQLGRISGVTALAGLIPFVWAVIAREWEPASAFLVMVGLFAVAAMAARFIQIKHRRLEWSHGMVVVALTWLLVPAVGAVPLWLSGHYGHPFDAYFDAMSGLSTTGLTLIQDLDHLAPSMNFWRHMLHFLGGQGIIIAALSLFSGGGVTTLYYGEARDERILPNVRSTARFIWLVAAYHLIVGVAALSAVAFFTLGFRPGRALFHGLMIFFAGFDTGGFSPQSTSIGYYHSAIFEAVTGFLMVAGAMSFGLHFALWRGPRKAVFRNLETKTILATVSFTMVLTMFGLAATGIYSNVAGLGRQGFFQVLSAHTGTGFATVAPSELALWSGLAFGGMGIAMALGGMASSTAGGVKSLRVGLTIRTIAGQVKQVLLPERAVQSTMYYQNGVRRFTPELGQAVMTVSLLYVALFLLGTGVALGYGYSLAESLFESVSAGASVGLSVGVTDPTMPLLLKITYTLQMWLGRLEFVAVFSLLGFLYSWVRGK
jgi:trk system potassium uptake protein TrkH